MRLVRPPAVCAECGNKKVFMRCMTLLNSCDKYLCFTCFGPHSDAHQDAWRRMSDTEREACIQDYERRHAQDEPPF